MKKFIVCYNIIPNQDMGRAVYGETIIDVASAVVLQNRMLVLRIRDEVEKHCESTYPFYNKHDDTLNLLSISSL